MVDCLFCRIADGKIPAKIEFQDDLAVASRHKSAGAGSYYHYP